ncbi:MAG: hypothetical protein K6T65_07725, partial [Peptococcaceae bacterium]|nr:hypothetical protein [Peptococcaceae bacterium]
VGTQAVFNVLLGERYKIIPREIENYVKGYYGRPAGPIGEELKRKALNGEEPITCRPADLLEPELPRAKQELDPSLVEKEEDYISYSIFPDIALKFFKWRKNPVISEEEPPQRQMGRREKALLDGASLEDLSEMLAVKVSEGVTQALQGLSVTISLGGHAAGVETASVAVPAARRSAVTQMEKEDLGVHALGQLHGMFGRHIGPRRPVQGNQQLVIHTIYLLVIEFSNTLYHIFVRISR